MGSGIGTRVHVSYTGLVCNLIGCREENMKLHAQAVSTFLTPRLSRAFRLRMNDGQND
jgi:hypothetical protein